MHYKTNKKIKEHRKIIIALRKQKDWSQTDLAKITGVSLEMIGKFERNEVVPSIEAAKKIANSLVFLWTKKENFI